MNRRREAEPETTYRPLWRAAVVTLMLLLMTAGLKSYRDLSVARAHETRLQQEIEDTRRRIETLADRIDRIENDDAMLEQLAREELGWVRDGDVVVVLPDEPASESP